MLCGFADSVHRVTAVVSDVRAQGFVKAHVRNIHPIWYVCLSVCPCARVCLA